MSDYNKTIQSKGNSEKIAANIADIFIHRGYLIETKNSNCIALKQTVMPNRNNDPLMAVSHISIEIREREINVNAALSGYDILFRILAIMLAGMAVTFVILSGFILKNTWQSPVLRFIIPALPLAPWPILLPLMKRFIKTRAVKMLNTVIQNATMVE